MIPLKMRIILFFLSLGGHLTLMLLKLSGVYLVERLKGRSGARAFQKELISRGVPKEAAHALAKQYTSTMSLREMIGLVTSITTAR